ncbi:carbonic anhydrase [Arachnia propionica]|uniref:carbonic anhydrase n=1 Tax=Arachnia propionica TaxID=1750 RepID=A0A3P1TD02_9ACTN|nr:carbonic anhydrase [Arachnia propionica]MDO5083747.1 carbonic anhydrase [Arachnia propionica]RRD07100.1 carbonic anhydrase [Arachnia propionica]
MSFTDLLAANREYASHFHPPGMTGVAQAGIAVVTCMDSRIDPLSIVGLACGDAKILRSPGGRVEPWTMTGLVLAVQLLEVNRILIIPHTRCAMSGTDEELHRRITERSGIDASWVELGASPDQLPRLRRDVKAVLAHPLIAGRAEVGGFLYDVETGLLDQVA